MSAYEKFKEILPYAFEGLDGQEYVKVNVERYLPVDAETLPEDFPDSIDILIASAFRNGELDDVRSNIDYAINQLNELRTNLRNLPAD